MGESGDGPGGAPVGKMRFRRMDEGTDADFQVLARVHQQNLALLPDRLLKMLSDLGSDGAYPVDRLAHSLQAATRARRDGAGDEMIVCALLHDIGETLGPLNHGEVVAAILRPFISEANHWMLAHHGLFQTYFYARHLGLDPNARDRFRDSPYYDQTCHFVATYDEVSFDPDYASDSLESFEPLVRALLAKSWTPPT